MDLEAIVARLRSRGQKVTPQRRQIIRVLIQAGGRHLSAQEVFERVRPVFPDISLDTVYRNLRLLVLSGVACETNLRVPQRSRFAIERDRHHHHLICTGCGKTQEIYECPVAGFSDLLRERYRFLVDSHALEVYGRCADCAAGA